MDLLSFAEVLKELQKDEIAILASGNSIVTAIHIDSTNTFEYITKSGYRSNNIKIKRHEGNDKPKYAVVDKKTIEIINKSISL